MSQRTEPLVREDRARQLAALVRSSLTGVLAQTHVRWLIAILALALVARLLWVAFVLPDPADGRVDDAAAHHQMARSLANGEGFVSAEGVPTANMPPGYPALLALAFLLPGDDIKAGVGLNVVAGLVIVAGAYYLGSRLWDRRAGLVAAAIMALFPSHIFSTSLLMKELPFTASLVAVLCLTLAWTLRKGNPTWHAVPLGTLVAFAGMVRPEGYILAPVIVFAWLICRMPLLGIVRNTVLLVLGISLLVVPWTVRNVVELEAPIVSATGGALVLIDGHHENAGGQADFAHSTALTYALRHPDLPPKEREVRIYEEATGDTIRYFFSHPMRELELAPHRLAWFFRGDRFVLFYVQNAADGSGELSEGEEQFWGVTADIYYYGVIGLMVFGLPFWLLATRPEHALLYGVFLAYVALWAFIFVGQARYHIPLLLVFAVLAAIGVSAALTLSQSRDKRTLKTASVRTELELRPK